MNLDPIRRICGPNSVSASQEHRVAYSRDASRIAGECLGVVWPCEVAQVSELAIWARNEGIDLVPRGAGTGLCGGATPRSSVVVDFSRMNEAGALDARRRHIRVEPGMVLEALNRSLAGAGLRLPVIPGSHRAATVGGMIATDAAGLHAVRYGSMRRWVERVTLIDGLGRTHELQGERLADVVGREGSTGFIVEAIVRLAEVPKARQVWLEPLRDEAEVLRRASEWLANPTLMALEYLNAHAASVLGWPACPHLLVECEGGGERPGDRERAAAMWAARDGLYPLLARSGHPVIEDPQLDPAGLASLLPWLAAENLPVFGHLGVGIIHPCFRDPDDRRVAALYERVAAAGGRVSGEHGVGLKKQGWVTSEYRDDVRRLKGVYDPGMVINRGKPC